VNVRALRIGCLLLGVGALFLPLLDDPPLQSGACVSDVRVDRAIVAMVTQAAVELRIEVFGDDGKLLPGAAAEGARRRHEFAVRGLQAGQRYTFRVYDDKGALRDQGSFRTPPADDLAPVRFATLGDSGDQPWWVWLQNTPLLYWPARLQWLPASANVSGIGAEIAAAEPQFVLHLGDIVYPYGKAAHWSTGFYRPFAQSLRTAPWYALLGNHDIKDDDGRQALANLVLPRDSGTGDGRCYSYSWGSVRVIALDLNVADSDHVDGAHPAVTFLRRELERAEEPWLVVASHFPIRSESRQGNRGDLMLELSPLLHDHGVDLYCSGHDHTYQRFDGHGEVAMVVSGGGGKSLYEFEHRPGEIKAAAKHSRYHWCQVDIAGVKLHLEAHALGGELLDTLELVHDEAWQRGVPKLNAVRAERIAKTRR